MQKAEISTTYIQAVNIDDSVYGINLTSDISADDIITMLKICYGIDERKLESYKIEFVKTDESSLYHIDNNDILEIDNSISKNSLLSEELSENKLNISYYNLSEEYNKTNSTYIGNNNNRKKLNINTPFSLDEISSYNLSENIIENIKLQNAKIKILLPQKYIYLSVNDKLLIEDLLDEKLFIKISNINYHKNKIKVIGYIYQTINYRNISNIEFMLSVDEGKVKQILLPKNYLDNLQNISSKKLFFINTYKLDKKISIYNKSKKSIFSQKISSGALIGKIVKFTIPEILNYRLIDKASYIDVMFDSANFKLSLLDLKLKESMFLVGKLLIYINKITKISDDVFRLSNFIYHYDPDYINEINIGDEIIYCKNYEVIEISPLLKYENIFYKDNQEYRKIIIDS